MAEARVDRRDASRNALGRNTSTGPQRWLGEGGEGRRECGSRAKGRKGERRKKLGWNDSDPSRRRSASLVCLICAGGRGDVLGEQLRYGTSVPGCRDVLVDETTRAQCWGADHQQKKKGGLQLGSQCQHPRWTASQGVTLPCLPCLGCAGSGPGSKLAGEIGLGRHQSFQRLSVLGSKFPTSDPRLRRRAQWLVGSRNMFAAGLAESDEEHHT